MTTVLVVDDHPRVRAGLSAMLRLWGFDVVTAEDGAAGLRALDRERVDAILCDVEMPVLDGFGLLEQVRSRPGFGAVPFLFLTGQVDGWCRQRALEMGANDFLNKPIGPRELLEAIQRQLDGLRTGATACSAA